MLVLIINRPLAGSRCTRFHNFTRVEERSFPGSYNEGLLASRLLKRRFINKFSDFLIKISLNYLLVENICVISIIQYAMNIIYINLTLFHRFSIAK